ncbi:hypothetical protein FSARC_11019 [Fusarium sarcochroum]|uniref:MACPF domain-containing protein n=1 Tax=Fusarium sarcochroum TaxID=1208366 RepID=A0A8H4TIN3_9HYPO|nr:hypothetical protein FSARC_11019 [Fusarium sarcochroum]
MADIKTKTKTLSPTESKDGSSAVKTQERDNEDSKQTGGSAVRFLQVNPPSEPTLLFLMKVTKDVLDHGTLEQLRGLVSESPAYKEYSGSQFCTAEGGSIDDSWLIKSYMDEIKTDQIKTDEGSSEGSRPGSAPFRFYVKGRDTGKVERSVPKLEQPKLDLTLPDDAKYVSVPQTKTLESGIVAGKYTAEASSGSQAYLSSFKEHTWAIISENNALCYGMSIVRRDGRSGTTACGVVRARKPAFQTKLRPAGASQLLSMKVPNQSLMLRIPDFIVDDQANVSIIETKNEFQSSLSKAAFSEWDIQASGGGVAGLAAVGASVGYHQSGSDAASNMSSSTSHKIHISYNFPRATVLLDEESLELTPECSQLLSKVKAKEQLEAFLKDYGEIFSQRIQLGGRLFASEECDASNSASATEVKHSLKAQAAASMKYGLAVEVSSSSSYGRSTGNTTGNSQASLGSTLQWEANGGDTLLCNNGKLSELASNEGKLNALIKPEERSLPDLEAPKAAIQPPVETRKFYLRCKGPFKGWKYLTVCKSSSSVSKPHARVSLEIEDDAQSGEYFEMLTVNGEPVAQPQYDTSYHIRNPSTGVFLSKDNGWLGARNDINASTECFQIHPKDGIGKGDIQQLEKVVLRSLDTATDVESRFAYNYVKTAGFLGISEDQMENMTLLAGGNRIFSFDATENKVEADFEFKYYQVEK